ncbi:MAG: 2-amino-4-hydroxy-6-hydroxymethyldihydropteridine diphosphokinase [Muribaculum sp.]|nr:2-amino-4-hydroxy-6-hydroxymethyldihydropteridine diphosphokinase [Muribaculum sp.]
MYVFINIGSNLGNRRLNISRALVEIEKIVGYFEISHSIETLPWGFVSNKKFLNVGLAFQTEIEPEALLKSFQEIEKKLNSHPHRDNDGNYADREIDIDIVAIDQLVIDTPTLKVPHPLLAKRRFFLEPLRELAPEWTHPSTGLTPAQMLANLPQTNPE